MSTMPSNVSVAITLGNGVELMLDKDDNLWVRHNKQSLSGTSIVDIPLGRATKRRGKDLVEYIQRLSIHFPEE